MWPIASQLGTHFGWGFRGYPPDKWRLWHKCRTCADSDASGAAGRCCLSPDGRLRFPYYLLNVQQRALKGLYVEFMTENGLRYGPPGDEERLRWELGLLSNEALRRVGAFYRGTKGGKDHDERG